MRSSEPRSQQGRSLSPQESSLLNQSFYDEKRNQTFSSLEFLEKYMLTTNLPFVIEKSVKLILESQRLPANPYYLLYRLVHHEATFQNLKIYFQNHQHSKFIVAGNEQQYSHDDNVSEGSKLQAEEVEDSEIMTSMQIKETLVHLSSKLSKYLHYRNTNLMIRLLTHKKYIQTQEALATKHHLKWSQSFGGPIIMDLAGERQEMKGPVKQHLQLAVYSAPSMLVETIYLLSELEEKVSIVNFSTFVLDNCLECQQYKDDNYTCYFQMLEIGFPENQSQRLHFSELKLEYSRTQVIENRGLILKEMAELLQKENIVLRVKCIYKLSKEMSQAVGEEYLTTVKSYILILQLSEEKPIIFSNSIVTHLLLQVFWDDLIISQISSWIEEGGQPYVILKQELVPLAVEYLEAQQLSGFSWKILELCIFESSESAQSRSYLGGLSESLSYILMSSVGWLNKLWHQCFCGRLLLLPNFPEVRENQTFLLFQSMKGILDDLFLKEDLLNHEIMTVLQLIRKLLLLLLEFKDFKKHSIVFILDNILILLKGLISSSLQIIVVLRANLIGYLKLQFEAIEYKVSSQPTLTYDQYLKTIKKPAETVLLLDEEVKRHKKALNLPEKEVQRIILAKYLNHCQLYETIYSFYWYLACGRKITFPLTQFLSRVADLAAIHQNAVLSNPNPNPNPNPKHKNAIISNKYEDIPFYEISHSDNSISFYSLHPHHLNSQFLQPYKNILNLISFVFPNKLDEPYMQEASQAMRYEPRQSRSNKSLNRKWLVSIKGLEGKDALKGGNEEIESLSSGKIYVDIILQQRFSAKNNYLLYQLILDELDAIMRSCDAQELLVLGLFCSQEQDLTQLEHQNLRVFSKLLDSNAFIRFDHKNKCSVDRFTRLLNLCVTNQKEIEMKMLYFSRDIIKTVNISFNFYYESFLESNNYSQEKANTVKMNQVFKTTCVSKRVFQNRTDLVEWLKLNMLSSQALVFKQSVRKKSEKKIVSDEFPTSIQKLQDQDQIQIIELVSEQSIDSTGAKELNLHQPFQQWLKRSQEITANLLLLLEFVKSDRRGKYQISQFKKTYDLLNYCLIEQCLRHDHFIFWEGAAVSAVNYVRRIGRFLSLHEDNIGSEMELLFLEREMWRLGNVIKYMSVCNDLMWSCRVVGSEALR